ncbi:Ig-like domain-containing protein [Pseudalkalibacillus sp. SCS-8]|uniref:Ig-like domain-containing protein n=1 Tax=Pseudalkalibacillus nanhaiensis TaxID=3115291 RepID=UPI0032DAF67B
MRKIGLTTLVACMIFSLFAFPGSGAAQIKKTFEQPENLGPMVTSVAAMDSAYGIEDGHDVMYTTVKGDPGVFQVVNLDTYELLRTYELEGLGGSWTHVVDGDGHVYIGGSGKLFKYDPFTKTVTDLGTVVPGAREVYGLSVDESGNVYGGTYPDAHVFRYSPDTGKMTDYGSVKSDQDYVRSLTYANGTIYAGIGIKGSIMTIDAATGEIGTLPVPDRPAYYDTANLSMIWALDVVGHYLFVHLSDGNFIIYNLENKEWLPETVTGTKGLAMTPAHDGKTYFVANGKIMSFDLNTEATAETNLTYGSYIRNAGWVTINDPELPGMSLATISFNGSVQLFNFETSVRKTLEPIVEGQPTTIQTLEKGPDGKLYSSGYMGTYGAQYDPSTDVLELFNLGQAEGMTSLNDKMYMGTYPGANIYEYDTTKSPGDADNPQKLFSLSSDGQDRPFSMTSGDGKVFIGTIPTYGELGGALTIYDPNSTSAPSTYRNVVENQSIIGLAYRDGKIYGSTSVWGGLGIDPTADAAKMFVWDVNAGTMVTEFTPDLPGTVPSKAIGELSFGPDGLLWGASYGTIFAMDPDTYEIVKSKEIVATDWNFNHYWRPIHLRWSDDGLLYTTLAGQITVIDPETLEHVQLDRSPLMTLGDDGNIYYADGADLKRITVKDGLPPQQVEIDVDLENASFEEVVSNGEIPGWSDNWKSGNASFQVTDERSFTGSKSLKIVDTGTSETVAVLSDPVEVIPGKEYTAKSQVYLETGRTIMILRFFDQQGKQLADEVAYVTTGKGQWQEVIASGYAPENAATARIYAYVSNYWTGTSYFDDFSLTYKVFDNELPGLEMTSPEEALITNDTTPALNFKTVHDSSLYLENGGELIGQWDLKANEATEVTVGPLAEGTHAIVAYAKTNEGIPGEEISITVVVDLTAPDAPDVISPDKPMSTNDRTPEVQVKAEEGAVIEILEDGKVIGTGIGAGEQSVTIKLQELEQGNHKLVATATDKAGNTSEESPIPHIIINNGEANGHNE